MEKFYLEEDQLFDSVPQLVDFYKRTNLSSVFADFLDVYLSHSLADACYELIREFVGDETDSQEYDIVKNPVGAAVMCRSAALPMVEDPNQYLKLSQGQLVFIVHQEPDSDTFHCCLSLSLSTTQPCFVVPIDQLRVITAFGAFEL